MKTGKKDRNGIIIKDGDTINLTNTVCNGHYTVSFGIGTYDMGEYSYLGWILTDVKGECDGHGWILTVGSNDLEIV